MMTTEAVVLVTPIPVRDVAGEDIAAGRTRGLADAPRYRELATPSVEEGGVILVDFKEMQVVTSSYFAAGIFPLWDACRRADGYPMLLRGSEVVLDEIKRVLEHTKTGAWHVGDDTFREPSLLGVVDGTNRTVLDLALAESGVTAADLYAVDRAIRPTAWSNRLAELHAQRLLRPTKVGRQLLYRLPWSEVADG